MKRIKEMKGLEKEKAINILQSNGWTFTCIDGGVNSDDIIAWELNGIIVSESNMYLD